MLCECLVGMDLYVNLRQGSSEEEILVICVVFYLKSIVILNYVLGFYFLLLLDCCEVFKGGCFWRRFSLINLLLFFNLKKEDLLDELEVRKVYFYYLNRL